MATDGLRGTLFLWSKVMKYIWELLVGWLVGLVWYVPWYSNRIATHVVVVLIVVVVVLTYSSHQSSPKCMGNKQKRNVVDSSLKPFLTTHTDDESSSNTDTITTQGCVWRLKQRLVKGANSNRNIERR